MDSPLEHPLDSTMLTELRIRDYAVIDDLRVELGPGLTVLTGETGAGKSIVVGALSLLLGERATQEVVRTGADRARVEAVFDISGRPELGVMVGEAGIPVEDGVLILAREVASEGRNRAWINGSPATAGLVGVVGRSLVDLHGQHEHQTLLRSDEQRAVLDGFAGALELAGEVGARHREVASLAALLEEGEARRRELEARADFIRFQWEEIRGAGVDREVDSGLQDELVRLEHGEELLAGARDLADLLYSGEEAISDGLSAARDRFRQLSRLDTTLDPEGALLDQAYHDVVEVGRRLERYAAAVELDPARLEEVRARLDLLHRLRRKYGPGLEEVEATGLALRAELDELENAGEDRSALVARVEEARGSLVAAADRLRQRRREAAGRLSRAVEDALPGLGMPGSVFRVELEPLAGIGPHGGDRVEFVASLNAGFEPRPLSRIASGGELSRVMLAVTSILAGVDRVPTLVFDEIDAGVGGTVALGVAERIAEVSDHHQVLVISHLPQVASKAKTHLLVEKIARGGVTTTALRALEGEERIRELARMLGGDPGSRVSLDHAQELLERAKRPSGSPQVQDDPSLEGVGSGDQDPSA